MHTFLQTCWGAVEGRSSIVRSMALSPPMIDHTAWPRLFVDHRSLACVRWSTSASASGRRTCRVRTVDPVAPNAFAKGARSPSRSASETPPPTPFRPAVESTAQFGPWLVRLHHAKDMPTAMTCSISLRSPPSISVLFPWLSLMWSGVPFGAAARENLRGVVIFSALVKVSRPCTVGAPLSL